MGELHLVMQMSSHKLLLFTHFSDEGTMIANGSPCNACSLTLLLETSGGLLVLRKSKERQLWQTFPCSRIVGTTDLRVALRSMLDEAVGQQQPAPEVCDARLLALADAGEAARDGFRHELIFSLRLAATADAVQKVCAAAGEEPLFVRAPHATAADDELILAVGFGAAMGGSFALTRSAQKALHLF